MRNEETTHQGIEETQPALEEMTDEALDNLISTGAAGSLGAWDRDE